jgi:glycosyltransferase involved in cell wall biosynthesis
MEAARDLMARAGMVFFNSRWVHQLAEKQIARKITNFAYFQYPVRFTFETPLPWPEAVLPRIAMVNRLDAWHKGLDLAIEAVARLRAMGTDVQLTIIGRGPDESYLRELACVSGVSDLLSLEPYTEGLSRFWQDQEILLLPSRFEGLAVSMIEAMGFGRPVLRTPYGGAAEWLEDGVNGFICPAAELDLLVATLQRALAERSRWRVMGLAAHGKIRAELSPRPAKLFLEALEKAA